MLMQLEAKLFEQGRAREGETEKASDIKIITATKGGGGNFEKKKNSE